MSVVLLALLSAPKAEELNTMEIVIKDKVYTVELAENQTTDALKKMLPLTIDMSELHGNEKYYYLAQIANYRFKSDKSLFLYC